MAILSPTSELARALDVRRATRRQAVAVVLLLAAAAAWRILPLHEPEPLTRITIAIGSVILVIELAIGWWEQSEAAFYADELILRGHSHTDPLTPIGCAVARRVAQLESPRARRRLAEGLRWRMKLAHGWTRPSPGYVRASVLPPLSPAQRLVFREDDELIAAIASRVEERVADPRALVALQRLMTLPPDSEPPRRTPLLADQLRDELHTVRRLIDAPADPSDSSPIDRQDVSI